MTILATVENDSIKLPPGVHLSNGSQVRIETLPDRQDGSVSPGWPENYFARTSGVLVAEPFERPDQGDLEVRGVW